MGIKIDLVLFPVASLQANGEEVLAGVYKTTTSHPMSFGCFNSLTPPRSKSDPTIKMKSSIATLTLLSSLTYALPTEMAPEADGVEILKRMFLNPRAIDASKPVPVDGQHAYHPANFAAGEIRGPCPGLNALVC
jgi:hypothetical protein